jgi:CP family cyanate transporter-like MFS transporter
VQGTGYAIASIAPALLGGVHDATGGWNAPLVVVLVSVLAFGGLGTWGAVRAHGRRPQPEA